MPRIRYVTKRFKPETQAIIDDCHEELERRASEEEVEGEDEDMTDNEGDDDA